MDSSSEIEIKFRVVDISALSARLFDLGFEQVTPRTHEMNTLFDLPGHPLRNRGDLLRLRKYGESWVLTHKGKTNAPPGAHKVRIETETGVADGEKMEAILRQLQFTPSFRYEKFRSEWKSGEGHVVIDETPLGNFAEIEGAPEWIDSVAQELGIQKTDYITETYAGLFFAWKQRTNSAAREMTFADVESSGPPPLG
jgi:adenylate cyclase, class 2